MILFPPGKMLASTMRSLKNQYKTEARNCIKGIHVMDVCQRYQWNMVPKAAQRKGAGSFEMGDTLLSYMVLS